jgi:hypothetical protein
LNIQRIDDLQIFAGTGNDSIVVNDLSGVDELDSLALLGEGGADSAVISVPDGSEIEFFIDGGIGDDQLTINSAAQDGSADAFGLIVVSTEAQLSLNGSLFLRLPGAIGSDTIILNGTNDDDSLTIDLMSGNPLPAVFQFNGMGNSVGDTLNLLNGVVNSVAHTFVNANDGDVTIDDASVIHLVTYTGLEPILDTITATDRVFNFGSANDDISLTDDGMASNNISRITSASSSEQVDFLNPTNRLTVNSNGGDDTIDLVALDSLFASDVILDGGDGNDDLIIDDPNPMWNGFVDLFGGDGDDSADVVFFSGGSISNVVFVGGNDDDTLTVGAGNSRDDETPDSFEFSGDDSILVNGVLKFFDVDGPGNDTVIFQGSSDDDELRIDFSGGTLPENIQFIGFGQATGDRLDLFGSTVTSVVHNFLNANDGNVDVDGLIIDYVGLEPITDMLLATHRVFNFGSGNDNITFDDGGDGDDGISRLSSVGSSETVEFANPTGDLTINSAGGNDTISLNSPDSMFSVPLTANAGDGDDVINVTPTTNFAITVNGDGQVSADTMNVNALGNPAMIVGSTVQVTGFNTINFSGIEVPNLLNVPATIDDQTFQVSEVAPDGTFVGQIALTTGVLGGLTFTIDEGNESNAFFIDEANGRISVNDTGQIQNELMAQFDLFESTNSRCRLTIKRTTQLGLDER